MLGPAGPGGLLASLWGERSLAFTFAGLVLGSVLSALPLVVQPIRNAFSTVGDRPLEVAATLRTPPTYAFFYGRRILGATGFSYCRRAWLCAYGAFGVVLMIGGNIPGHTKVLSAIVSKRRAGTRQAGLLAAW